MSFARTSAAAQASGTKARLLGLLILAIGAAFCWFFACVPLQQAQAHAANIEYNPKIFLLGPLLLFTGLVLLVGNRSVAGAMASPPRTRQQHMIVWPLFALGIAVGGFAWWWYDAKLQALGYVTHY